jgi:hypothetical protein
VDLNAKVEQYMYTGGGVSATGKEKGGAFSVWAQSAGLGDKFWNSYENIREVVRKGEGYGEKRQSRRVLKEGAKPISGLAKLTYHGNKVFINGAEYKQEDTLSEDYVSRHKIDVIDESRKGDLGYNADGSYPDTDANDYREKPEEAEYRIISQKLPDGRLEIMRMGIIHRMYSDLDGRIGNYFVHSYVFPVGTEIGDIDVAKLAFKKGLDRNEWGKDAIAAPAALDAQTVMEMGVASEQVLAQTNENAGEKVNEQTAGESAAQGYETAEIKHTDPVLTPQDGQGAQIDPNGANVGAEQSRDMTQEEIDNAIEASEATSAFNENQTPETVADTTKKTTFGAGKTGATMGATVPNVAQGMAPNTVPNMTPNATGSSTNAPNMMGAAGNQAGATVPNPSVNPSATVPNTAPVSPATTTTAQADGAPVRFKNQFGIHRRANGPGNALGAKVQKLIDYFVENAEMELDANPTAFAAVWGIKGEGDLVAASKIIKNEIEQAILKSETERANAQNGGQFASQAPTVPQGVPQPTSAAPAGGVNPLNPTGQVGNPEVSGAGWTQSVAMPSGWVRPKLTEAEMSKTAQNIWAKGGVGLQDWEKEFLVEFEKYTDEKRKAAAATAIGGAAPVNQGAQGAANPAQQFTNSGAGIQINGGNVTINYASSPVVQSVPATPEVVAALQGAVGTMEIPNVKLTQEQIQSVLTSVGIMVKENEARARDAAGTMMGDGAGI